MGKELWRVLVVDNSRDHDKPHFDLFIATISTSKKMIFIQSAKRARAEKGITRHIDASSVVWLGPSNFWLVRFEHEHASYPRLSFRPPGFNPYMGREERGVQGLDYRSLQIPHIPVTAFSQTDLFLVWIYVQFRSPQEPQWQNCNHKHRLMSTCGEDVDMFSRGLIALSLPKRAHVDRNWPISREKSLKIDWSVKIPLHWLIMGVAGS